MSKRPSTGELLRGLWAWCRNRPRLLIAVAVLIVVFIEIVASGHAGNRNGWV